MQAIAGFRLVSQDPVAIVRFYVALGFQVGTAVPIAASELALLGIEGAGERWPLRIGAAQLAIDRFACPGRPYPANTNAASACFQHLALVTTDVAAAWTRAVAAGATPISRNGPVTLPPSAGGVTAVKFRDPDGHPLELIEFADGAARGWHGQGIVGIDHSAIAVTDRARSEAFYAARGLARGAATLNHGPTQVALDALDDVRVDVVPMAPSVPTPHVELLHYRIPAEAPWEPWSPQDVVATRIVWAGGEASLVRDPDGHLHQFGG